MKNVSLENLFKLKQNFENKRIAVLGDMMLDSYLWGSVKRISPEAPVPVVEIEKEFTRFGGAANVALNISTLKGIPYPVGIIGYDSAGADFTSLLKEKNISKEGIFISENRPTTIKTRVMAENQHVVRVDKESTDCISTEFENSILEFFKKNISDLDAIILEDYNKGILTEHIISEIIKLANLNNKIITVDPKFHNFLQYKNVTVFKPNKKEAEDALGVKITNNSEMEYAGKKLLDILNAKYILLTLGESGIALFEENGTVKKLPTKARKVADVSGAGDTVISTLTMALCAGADIYEAAFLANWAGGIVCETAGIIPIELNTLFETINEA